MEHCSVDASRWERFSIRCEELMGHFVVNARSRWSVLAWAQGADEAFYRRCKELMAHSPNVGIDVRSWWRMEVSMRRFSTDAS